MEIFIKTIEIINKNYDVDYKLMGGNENKILILQCGKTAVIIDINVGNICNTYLFEVIKEYCKLFECCMVKFIPYPKSKFFNVR